MINSSYVTSPQNIKNTTDTIGGILKAYIKSFITSPFIVGGITAGILLIIFFCMKQFGDHSETTFQGIIFNTAIHILVFIGVLLFLIAFDAGYITFLNFLRG